MNQDKPVVYTRDNTEPLEQENKDAFDINEPSPYARYVYLLTSYYTFLVLFSLWLLTDTVLGGRNVFLNLIGFSNVAPDHVIRTIVFVATGALLGNVLYQIRQLYKSYCKPKSPGESFNPRWLGKYLSAPWEAVGLALIVVALIGGTVPDNAGQIANNVNPKDYPTSHLNR